MCKTQSFLSQLASAKARAESLDAPVGRPVQLPSYGNVVVGVAGDSSLMRWFALACSLVWLSESGRFGRCIFVHSTGCALCLRSLSAASTKNVAQENGKTMTQNDTNENGQKKQKWPEKTMARKTMARKTMAKKTMAKKKVKKTVVKKKKSGKKTME